jgi:histidyl-tRNA synthetase
MSTQIPQTLKGFRDFLPAEKQARDFVEHKIVEIFQQFGFDPLETPTLEYAELLTGKYGDEADKLVYTFEDKGGRKVGLRYDQTVPSARVLAQYQHQLPKFFRRYQLQNVFRADKPQKGRYREFRQCDIDIFGSNNPVADAEILACAYFAYKNVGFPQVKLNINHRKQLIETLTPFCNGTKLRVLSAITSIDKFDKVGSEGVISELISKGMEKNTAEKMLATLQKSSPTPELQLILDEIQALGVAKNAVVFNPLIARGLDYYTGMIFEVTIPEFKVGSVGGGGRYDNLIEDLSGISMPAVGMAFGFDRTVEAAQELGLLSEQKNKNKVLVAYFDQSTLHDTLQVAAKLRSAGITAEMYPENDKLGKQFKLADQKNIPWVVLVGEEEAANATVTLKNMETGKQETMNVEKLLTKLSG